MKFNYLKLGLMAGAIVAVAGCQDEDELVTGTTETLDCGYFTENRTLEDKPGVAIDYLITCDATISADVTIMPGVTIAFATDAGLKVDETGSLTAEGTAEQPITFTGEDGVNGSWRGILIYSNDPKNSFDHCVVEYAGGTAHNSNGDRGAFIVWSDANITLTNSIVRNSGNHAFNASYNGSSIALGGNTFTDNDGAPMYIRYTYVGVPDPTDMYAGNTVPRILVTGGPDIEVNTTWRKVDVDYQIEAGNVVQVRDNATLTMEPGLNVYFESGSSMRIKDESALVAIGTEQNPIGLLGTVEAPGAWGGLYFNSTANVLNELDHVTVKYAGNPDFDGAIYMWSSPVLTVSNTEISYSGSCAFYTGTGVGTNPNLTVQNVVMNNNAGADFCSN